jgi:hypothetical protein
VLKVSEGKSIGSLAQSRRDWLARAFLRSIIAELGHRASNIRSAPTQGSLR